MNRPTSRSRKKSAPVTAVDELPLDFGEGTVKSSVPSSLATAQVPIEIVPGPLDERFAALMVRLNGKEDAELAEAARLASAWRAAGHICVPLDQIRADDRLAQRLLATRVVGRPGEWKPLILDEKRRLYLQRYWQYEHQLAAAIQARVTAAPPEIDRDLLSRQLDTLFEPPPGDQRTAAQIALTSNFSIVTGGPGTGKTRTAAGILLLLHAQITAKGSKPRFALAAPTGKAAARMTEAIRHALASMSAKANGLDKDSFLSGTLAAEAVTLHRLLGITPEAPVPRFNSRALLPFDAILVDEASMVDLALMAKLFEAAQPGTPIILFGDKDQLASVEAGHVLGDICFSESGTPPSRVHSHIVELRKSYRFSGDSGLKRLSTEINAGQADTVLATLRSAPTDVRVLSLPPADQLGSHLRERVKTGFRNLLRAGNPHEALIALTQFRVLCALRKGPFGVESLNRATEQALSEERLIKLAVPHYHGRPIIILRNDYTLRLFNGDTGVILRDPESGGDLRAFFIAEDGSLRRLLPARLPEHETVWAMTVHKSQGSEFENVLLILPDRDSPVLTRELVYTGVTRSRKLLELWYRDDTLRSSILRRTERISGLADALRAKRSE